MLITQLRNQGNNMTDWGRIGRVRTQTHDQVF